MTLRTTPILSSASAETKLTNEEEADLIVERLKKPKRRTLVSPGVSVTVWDINWYMPSGIYDPQHEQEEYEKWINQHNSTF